MDAQRNAQALLPEMPLQKMMLFVFQGKTNSKSPKSHQQPFEATADMLAPLDMGLPNSEWDWMDHTGLSCSGGSENSMHAFKSGALHRHVSKFCPTENNLYSPPTPEKGGGLCTTPFHLVRVSLIPPFPVCQHSKIVLTKSSKELHAPLRHVKLIVLALQ